MQGYRFQTKVGPFYIVPKQGRWHAVFDDDSLGSYASPQQAAEDLAGGHTISPSKVSDTSRLGISDDIGNWQRIDF